MGNSRIIHADIYTPLGNEAVKGTAMGRLHSIKDGEVEITDGIISYVGPTRSDVDSPAVDAMGRVVLPGFVDSHTHLVFGGYRPE